MKKLLITAIGAAVAFGAFADAVRFESEENGTKAITDLPGGAAYWSEPEGATNTYTVGAAGTIAPAPLPIASGSSQPDKALDIKTTFGKPLSLNAVSGGTATNINDGLYFDSLVKFTVCDAGQNAAMYTGAKIVMWLEQTEDESKTNLIVRAGYLSLSGDTVTSTPTNYVCTLTGGIDVDAWHRVTIKAIADITTTGRGVPGFAIYLDENGDTATSDINAGTAVMLDDSFPASELTEAAALLNDSAALFPSLDVSSGNKATLTSASFDGTGSITDLIFTDNGPAFAQDMVAPKASVKIGNDNAKEYGSLAEAVAAVNEVTSGDVKFTLSKGMTIDSTLAFASTANVVLDFAGCVLTNEAATAAISNAGILTITNSVGNGGIRSDAEGAGVALSDDGNGSLTITAGSFWGTVSLDESGTYSISGGSFKDDTDLEVEGCLAEGKSIVLNSETGLYDVVDNTWAGFLGDPVNGAYEIDNLAELKAFQANVGTLATAGETFKLTADIALDEAWGGIGVKGGKDLVNGSGKNISAYEAGAFSGTFDGQNHTISNFQMENGTDYGGFFNSVNGATISNLKITYKEGKLCANSSSTGGDTGATFVGVARNSTLQNLTALAGTVTTVSASKDMAGIVAYLMPGSTVDSCTNELNVASLLTAKARKSGGIALITQEGDGTATIRNCKNSGTVTLANAGGQAGGIVGYVGTNTTIECCENTAAVRMLTLQSSGSVTMQGTNKGNATVLSSNEAIDGLNFATVDGNVATFVADNALAAGNTYKVMATGATATCQLTAYGDAITFDQSLATATFNITAASGLVAKSNVSQNSVVYTADWAATPAEHPWYENPSAVVLAQDLPKQDGNIVSAFHGQGAGSYLGLTYSTNPLRFDLFGVDGTNALTTIHSVGTNVLDNAGFRGVAISETLGVAMTLAYAKTTTMYTFPLESVLGGNGQKAVTKPDTHAFDAGAFSPDGKYFFSNAIAGESSNQFYVKWSVLVDEDTGALSLTKVGSISAGGRGRSMAYARINGRDLVFGLVDTGKVVVMDMTDADSANWTAADLITNLPAHSYGTLCVSGVKVSGGTPHLTVATSANNGATKVDVLNVYALTVPASDTVTASLTKSFDEDALTAAGFGDISDANRYGNTVYVTEDEATIYFARPDCKLYAGQYAAAPVVTPIDPATDTPSAVVPAVDAGAAIEAVEVTTPTEAGSTPEAKAAYKDLFTYTAVETSAGSGVYTVTMTGIKETVQETVEESAMDVLDGKEGAKVQVPAGLEYKVTTYTELGKAAVETKSGTSDGTGVSVSKPGTTQGFIKVEMGTKSFNQ